jgi:hypothetical protein
MLLHNFAALHLHDQSALLNPRQARAHIMTPGVVAPAIAFLSELLLRCGREVSSERQMMFIDAFRLVKFGGSTDKDNEFGPRSRIETIAVDAAVQFVAAVNTVLEECGTGAEYSLELMTAETAALTGTAIDTFGAAYVAFRDELKATIINKIEIQLSLLYHFRTVYIPPSAIDPLYIEANNQVVLFETQYERLSPEGLAAFRAAH